jgi:Secretion system C-terminal sorting domain
MKKVLLFLLLTLAYIPMFAQSGPVAPGTGIYAIIDTSYKVGTTTMGYSKAKITLKNTTTTKYTAVQFRVFYDKNAFTSASVALLGSTSNLDLQSIDSNANGFVTVSLVYTGSSAIYSMPDSEKFEITFNHKPAATFVGLASVDSLRFTGASVFPKYASTQAGIDTVLNLYSYGGAWLGNRLNFHGTFKNVTGTPAKNLTLALEKKPHTGSTWSQHATYITNNSGQFSFSELIDTTYYAVRLAVKGDTMNVGNVISTADAQLINQWVLGNGTMTGFDFYAADVNGSNTTTISDAYGVFGRISGRFSAWPNSVQNIKFFTESEYNTINGSTTSYTSTIPGVTNFYYTILPGQPDSVTYYVAVPGDANKTGYHMARVTPIEVLVTPQPGIDSQIHNVIDQRVQYDFPTASIEVNVPQLSVQEGTLVNIPVKVFTNNEELGSLQFGLKYNDTLLEFKGVHASESAGKWLTYVNPENNQVDWGGYDNTSNVENKLKNGDEVVTLQFIALKPQKDWNVSPLWTSEKFAGNIYSQDLNITPTNGIIKVMRIHGGSILNENSMEIYPNPTTGPIVVAFNVGKQTNAKLCVLDLNGKSYMTIAQDEFPAGNYKYSADLGELAEGLYVVTLTTENGNITSKVIKQK